jgi:hypothetical protein
MSRRHRPRGYAGVRISTRGIRPYAGIGCLIIPATLALASSLLGLLAWHVTG